MISIKIKFLSILSDLIGKEDLTLSLQDNINLESVIEKVTSLLNEEIKASKLNSPEIIKKYILFSLNGKDIRSFKSQEYDVSDGDEISLLPAIAGG